MHASIAMITVFGTAHRVSYSLNGRSDDMDLPHDEDGAIHDI